MSADDDVTYDQLIREAGNTRGYSEGDLRSLIRGLVAALKQARGNARLGDNE